ncbi:MAG TPA: helix-turn-helix domain-containing protein [Pyrinomonadaceae bacterium]|nr:helix-turn-helix domain-containing protein [Pyrinomonadaceae bacterium]
MNLSTEVNRRFVADRTRHKNGDRTESKPRGEYSLVETDITDLSQAASRIDALRSLILIFLREVDSLKKVVGPRPRKKGDPIKLDSEIDAFEAALIRDALIKSKGNQRDAAKLLSIKPTTLNAKMKRLGITVETAVTAVD